MWHRFWPQIIIVHTNNYKNTENTVGTTISTTDRTTPHLVDENAQPVNTTVVPSFDCFLINKTWHHSRQKFHSRLSSPDGLSSMIYISQVIMFLKEEIRLHLNTVLYKKTKMYWQNTLKYLCRIIPSMQFILLFKFSVSTTSTSYNEIIHS